jgi:hypothetical protein
MFDLKCSMSDFTSNISNRTSWEARSGGMGYIEFGRCEQPRLSSHLLPRADYGMRITECGMRIAHLI